jgi:nucleoside-diphosphate-sugar epimerase
MRKKNISNQPQITDFTILGAGGFLGSHLLPPLIQRGYSVSTPTKITSDVSKVRHGHIIYCIGLTSDFRRRPLDTMQAHVCILRDLLEHTEFESLTYLSSTRVYHGASTTEENSALCVNPVNLEDLYAISKIAGESLCHQSGRENIKVLRLSNIVGFRKDSDLFIDELLNEIVTLKSLTLKSSLLSNKDYLCIDDAVKAVIAFAESKATGCFNVASGINISNQMIIDQLMLNFHFELTTLEAAPVIEFMPINVGKIKKTIQFQPTQFSDYFPQFINFYKKSKGIK